MTLSPAHLALRRGTRSASPWGKVVSPSPLTGVLGYPVSGIVGAHSGILLKHYAGRPGCVVLDRRQRPSQPGRWSGAFAIV